MDAETKRFLLDLVQWFKAEKTDKQLWNASTGSAGSSSAEPEGVTVVRFHARLLAPNKENQVSNLNELAKPQVTLMTPDDGPIVILTTAGHLRQLAAAPRVQFAVQLIGPGDDLLVGVFETEPEARKFITDNPPRSTETDTPVGPLCHAADVQGRGPDTVFGFLVTELRDGQPFRSIPARWEGETFDSTLPLFPSKPRRHKETTMPKFTIFVPTVP